LPDELVDCLDQRIEHGDAAILAGISDNGEFDGLAAYAAEIPMEELD